MTEKQDRFSADQCGKLGFLSGRELIVDNVYMRVCMCELVTPILHIDLLNALFNLSVASRSGELMKTLYLDLLSIIRRCRCNCFVCFVHRSSSLHIIIQLQIAKIKKLYFVYMYKWKHQGHTQITFFIF